MKLIDIAMALERHDTKVKVIKAKGKEVVFFGTALNLLKAVESDGLTVVGMDVRKDCTLVLRVKQV